MWNFLQSGTKEQAIEETKDQEETNGSNDRQSLLDINMDGDESGRNEHYGRHRKPEGPG